MKPTDNEPIPTIIKNVRSCLAKAHPGVKIKEAVVSGVDNAASLVRSQKPAVVLLVAVDIGQKLVELTEKVPIVISDLFTPSYMKLFTDERVIIHTLDIPISRRIEYIEKILPGPKTIGIIFNPKKNTAVVEEGEKYCQDRGLTLKKFPVTSEKDMVTLSSLKIDVLLVIPDSFVCGTLSSRYIMTLCLKEMIPMMGISEYFAQAGAVMAISPDLDDYSRKLSETIAKLLDGADPAAIPDVYPEKIDYFINIAMAKREGVIFKNDAMAGAKKIFGQGN